MPVLVCVHLPDFLAPELFFSLGEFQTLERLKLAIEANQKKFVTHPSVQQLLAAIWYEGLPGFRRLHIVKQVM